MNADIILETFARRGVDYILIGGMNFLLRHQPVATFDIDFWVRDTDENLRSANDALRELGAKWGLTEETWGPVSADIQWLHRQSVFCLTSPHGAIDIFRDVVGLTNQYDACHQRASLCRTASGISYRSLSDGDMLACQMALSETARRQDRVDYLKKLLENRI